MTARRNSNAGPRFHEDPSLPFGRQDVTIYKPVTMASVFSAPPHRALTVQAPPPGKEGGRVRTRRQLRAA